MNANRRHFVKTGALALAAPFVPWTHQAFANSSKNDRPLIGCIGLGRRGVIDAREHSRFGDIVAICDVDEGHAREAKSDAMLGGENAKLYSDYRKILDRKDIDV